MRPSQHLAVSVLAGGGTWAATGEPWALALTTIAGVAADVDHVPDLWRVMALGRKPKLVLFFHGWEWLGLMCGISFALGWPWWMAALVSGYATHLVTDHVFNGAQRLGYSLAYRALKGFEPQVVAKDWDIGDAYVTLQKEMPWVLLLVKWYKARNPVEGPPLPKDDR